MRGDVIPANDGRECVCRYASSERGSGAILAIAIMAAMLALLSLLVPLSIVLSAKQRISGAADAAALAAADVLAGILPGVPCAAAASVASANGVALDGCGIDGAVVTVRARGVVLGFPIAVRASAGPPIEEHANPAAGRIGSELGVPGVSVCMVCVSGPEPGILGSCA